MTPTAGYTLLEMVVVVGVMAMATAVVGPSGYRMIQSWREADEVGAVMKSLEALPTQARRRGTDLRLEDDQVPADIVALPEGWRLQFEQPLVVRANGACSDGSGVLVTARQEVPFEVQAPFCRLSKTAAAPP